MRRTSRGYLLLALAVVSISTCAAKEVFVRPSITETSLEFLNGEEVALGTTRYEVQIPRPDIPEQPAVIEVSAQLVEAWERVLVITRKGYFEGGFTQVEVYDYNGNRLGAGQPFSGKIIALKKVNRLVLAGMSADYGDDVSEFLNPNGHSIRRVRHANYAFEFGWTEDETIFWSFGATFADPQPPGERGSPATDVVIFDIDGNKLEEFSTTEQGPIRIEIGDRVIDLNLPEPRIPG